MESLQTSPVSAIAKDGYYLRFTCTQCGHVSDGNPILLQQCFPRWHGGYTLNQLAGRMKCSDCGAHNPQIEPVKPNF